MANRILQPLPIDAVMPELLAVLAVSAGCRAVVLRAPTGAGKTTRVPPALLAAGVAGEGRIAMLEPRRVAARAAARRMADEQGWEVGREVGYQVRFDRRAGPETRILVVTEGLLVQRLQADPFLEGIGALIFDELHERSLDADLALAMARRVQREVRPDLAIVAMSATLDAGPVAEFLGGCPIIESAGRLHPVEIRYGEEAASDRDPRTVAARVAAGVRRALAETAGGVLAFLPGAGEIRRTEELLAPFAGEQGLDLLPLYGDLPAERQDAALRASPRRKVVLATNVAETSVTVEGIEAVVDSGLARMLRFDPATGLDRLELARISGAAAEQRAGRAGREGPGVCYRLWPAWEHATLPERETPEVARVDLAGTALQLLAWGETDLAAFGWLEAPEPAALGRAADLLARLGATDGGGVTPLGQAMARLPVHPRLGRLLLEGQARGHGREAALLAALLAERDPFRREPGGRRGPRRASRSDLLDRLDALAEFEASGGRRTETAAGTLAPAAARLVLQARDQLAGLLRPDRGGGAAGGPEERDDVLLRAMLAAYPDRLARRREPGSPRGVLIGGRGVRLAEESAVLEPELFVAVDLDAGRGGQRAEALVRLASGVELEWLAELAPGQLRTEPEVEFDEARERILARRRTRFDDLVVAEAEVPPPEEEAGRALAAAAAERLDRALPLAEPEVASFLARLRCLAAWRPELGLPTFEESGLRELLPALAAGKRSFVELRRAPLLAVLEGTLTHAQREALAREAPERLEVPSGSRIRLRYEPGAPPVLAARIQELFGLAETPRIAGGRVPVLLHLLAPNLRPQQVTRDLESFWRTTYPQVKKELQGRYPRHAWPDDPWTARPERRPQRK